ncbi:HAMP domain-containing histidine kinase [Candidatus Bathyarchaeota archaeon]|nr:HAMP domain-containing histidine kinase [Candidatus Bathyarchaeota archaeon]
MVLLAFLFIITTITLTYLYLRQRKRLKAMQIRVIKLEESHNSSLEYIEALWESQKVLIQDEKLTSLNTLVARMAHELNTPLGVSLTALSYIEDLINSKCGKKIADDAKPMVEMTMRNLQKSISVVDNLAEISAGGIQEVPKPVKLTEFINFACYRDNYHDIEFDVDDNVWIKISQYGLSIVLKNILDNAVDYAFNNADKQGFVKVTATKQDENLLITVQDNGCGIKSNELRNIYDPFYTTRRGDDHNGLGLAIAYNILGRLYNGNIQCNSSTTSGTEFRIYIPNVICKKSK